MAATAAAPSVDMALNRVDPFDIQNHTQYRTLLATWQKECDAKICPPSSHGRRGRDRGDITTHPDINRYVLKASLPSTCLVEGFFAAEKNSAPAESVADIKTASAQMLKLNILNKPSTKIVADIYHNVVAVERGQKKLSDMVKTSPPIVPGVPAVVHDLQKMLAHKVEVASNQKRIEKIQKKTAQSIEQFQGDHGDNGVLENQLEAAKARIDNYAFKNARLREEIHLLRKMCNERIMNLWNETESLRHKQKAKEQALRHKEASLDKTQGELEARDLRISEQQRTQQDKFLFVNSQVQMYRSVSERYKQELDTLKKTIQAQNAQTGQQMSRTQDLCAQRVEQYRKMYEQSLLLLQELRSKAAQTPAVSDKINRLQGTLTQAVRNVGDSNRTDDPQIIGVLTKVGQNMNSLEQNIQSYNNPAENMMWYNNKATGDYAAF